MILTACFLLSAAVFITANTAIAKECYDKNGDFATAHKNNNNFLVSGLVMGPLCIVCALMMMALATRAP